MKSKLTGEEHAAERVAVELEQQWRSATAGPYSVSSELARPTGLENAQAQRLQGQRHRKRTRCPKSASPDPAPPARIPAPVRKILRPLAILQDVERLQERDAWLQPGKADVVNWLVKTVDDGDSIEWDLFGTADLASYIKRRLAEFGPLIPKDKWPSLLLLEETVSSVREFVKSLPEANRMLVVQLLQHLHRLQPDTRLLAIAVLAPALANDYSLSEVGIQLKAKFMIENASAICDVAGA